MPADNISGFKAEMIHALKDQGIEIARWPGGNFVSAYDWRDGIGDADKRPPRGDLAWGMLESNDMGIDDFMTFCCSAGAALHCGQCRPARHLVGEQAQQVNGRLGEPGRRAAL